MPSGISKTGTGMIFFGMKSCGHIDVPSITLSNFQRTHDIILRYSKGTNATWNRQYEPKPASTLKKLSDPKIKSAYAPDAGRFTSESASAESKGVPLKDVWEISGITPSSKERLGYPTQKPRVLYERMIRASSNEGDTVLDPFCGCGTTIDAAHTLKRQWIGVDLTILAMDPIRDRLEDRHGLKPSIDYEIEAIQQTNRKSSNWFAIWGNTQTS